MYTTPQDHRGNPEPFQSDTVAEVFTFGELSYLHENVRHEIADAGDWQHPPCSLGLNEQLAFAIMFCLDNDVHEAAITLDYHDTLVIDSEISLGDKDEDGNPVGLNVLRKSTHARQILRQGAIPTVDHDPVGSVAEPLRAWLAQQPPQSGSTEPAAVQGGSHAGESSH